MLIAKMDQHINKSLKRFIKKQGRINFELRQLIQLTKTFPRIRPIIRVLQQPQTTIASFKLLILVNRLIIQKTFSDVELQQILTSIIIIHKGQFQEILVKKLLQPYRLYLQRRACTQIGCYMNSQNQTRVFQMLNLINMGTSFADVIYTFGRYYLHKYGCAIDFNITIGADLQMVYNDMVDHVNRPASKNILEQIQMVHEKMYIVFYNCYFHKYLKSYVPKWVITDSHFYKDTKEITHKAMKSSSDSKLSRKSTAASKNYMKHLNTQQNNLGESCLYLFQKVEQQVESVQFEQQIQQNPQSLQIRLQAQKNQDQRFKLLLSMQRVVSMFKE